MHLFRHARVPTACLPPALAPSCTEPLVIEPWLEYDIMVEDHVIRAVTPSTPSPAAQSLDASALTDLGGVLVWPGLLDAHTHLDKTHTWERAPNPRGEFWDAIEILRRDSQSHWTPDDLYKRADFALRSA